jgi:hypothetical protein
MREASYLGHDLALPALVEVSKVALARGTGKDQLATAKAAQRLVDTVCVCIIVRCA